MAIAREDVVESVRGVLSRHSVEVAVPFGSVSDCDGFASGDIDGAVEFTADATGSGYSDTYLRLLTELDDTLGMVVDLVPIQSMSPGPGHSS